MGKHRVLILGIDGGTFNILGPLLEQGRLPNLARLIANGVSGTLRSTFPPVTCPAWPSFATGLNCGKHGLITFIIYNPATGKAEFVNNRKLAVKKIWQYASHANKSVACISVPITYPADQFDGLMLSGFPAYTLDDLSFHPAELREEFRKFVGDFDMSARLAAPHLTIEQKVEQCARVIESELSSRVRGLEFAHKRRPLDLGIVVWKGIDTMQHSLYGLAAPPEDGDPCRPALREAVARIYEKVDQAVGQCIEIFGDDADVLVISDHGFTRLRRGFLVNEFLGQHGLLEEKLGYRLRAKANALAQVLRRRLGLYGKSRTMLELGARSETKRTELEGAHLVWSKTQAYSALASSRGIWLNLAERSPNGIVKPGSEQAEVTARLKELLMGVKNPDNGQPFFRRVVTKEEVFEGPYLDTIPDLVLDCLPGYRTESGRRAFRHHRHPSNKVAWPAGEHEPEGIFIATGPSFRKGVKLDADLWDIAPTTLHLLGIRVPEMDGKVVKDALTEAVAVRAPEHDISAAASDTRESSYSVEAEDEITQRLMDLGYL